MNLGKTKSSEEKEYQTRKTLEREIYDSGAAQNIATGVVIVLYLLVTTSIPVKTIFPVGIAALITCVVLQFLVAPITNKLITQNLSDDLDSFYNYESNTKERTKLLKQLMACPAKIGIQVFLVFMIGGSIWINICKMICGFSGNIVMMFGMSLFFGAYTGALLGVIKTQKVCSSHAIRIVAKGVLKEEVEEKHTFGTKSTAITILHIFAPLLLLNISFFLYVWIVLKYKLPMSQSLIRIALMAVINAVYYVVFSTMLFKRMMRSINQMKNILEGMDRENFQKVGQTPTDLSNEFMYNIYLINTIIDLLQSILKKSTEVSMEVIESSNELSVISKETAVTSLEQSSGVKELLAAMEESDGLSKNIAEKINEVSMVAKRTTEAINDGFDILKKNMGKLDEIKQANEITVEGIRALSDKISGISDIAGIINSIADQTNIIAFNAELEASSAGNAGENFRLVSNEIRRLTNSTIQSTNEIRNRIIEIQHSSENLLSVSQAGSKKIIAGTGIINKLHENFEDLKYSSETTDVASSEIKSIIDQQTASFEQIVVTLRQISLASESFEESTQIISQSAENLCLISDDLKRLQIEQTEVIAEEEK